MSADALSILIITHRGGNALERCLQSIYEQSFQPNRICVVYASTEHHPFPNVEVYSLGDPTNYAEAVNFGFKKLDGQRILVLNDDTVLTPNCLSGIESMSNEPCIIQPKILLQDNPDQIENTGHLLWPDGCNFARGRGQNSHQSPNELLIFSGAAFVISKEIYRDVGLFCPDLSPFGEDVDYALRVIRRGWKIEYSEQIVIHHKLGGSYGRMSTQKIYWIERHRLLLMIRSAPLPFILLMPSTTFLRYILQWVGSTMQKGSAPKLSSGVARSLFLAHGSALKRSPLMIMYRFKEQSKWQMTDRTLLLSWLRQLPKLGDIWHPPLASSSQHTELRMH